MGPLRTPIFRWENYGLEKSWTPLARSIRLYTEDSGHCNMTSKENPEELNSLSEAVC